MIVEITNTEMLEGVINLLKRHNLPWQDLNLNQDLVLVGIMDNHQVVGSAGLEKYRDALLLRSVCLEEDYRGKGWAGRMLERLREMTEEKDIYLLTETAEAYFSRAGFMKTERAKAPESIRNSKEFASICPDSAVLMVKKI